MGGLSWWHWMIVLAVFVLLFGGKKLPDAARGVGRSLRILKSEVSAMHEDDKPTTATEPTDPAPAAGNPVPVPINALSPAPPIRTVPAPLGHPQEPLPTRPTAR